MGGLGWGNPFATFPDSAKVFMEYGNYGGTYTVRLNQEWTQYEILLPAGTDLSRVGCGFAWTVSTLFNSVGEVTFYMDDIRYEFAEPRGTPAFIQSYESVHPATKEGTINNFAYTYDNALAAMAMSYAGNHAAARRIADALVYAVWNDRTFDDGRLRNVYSSGDPRSFPGWESNKGEEFARMPGFFNLEMNRWDEDFYAASSSTGNLAWAILALCEVYKNTPEAGRAAYLDAAVAIAELIRTDMWCDRGAGGFTGGFQGWDDDNTGNISKPVTYKSVEHNIDLITAFSLLATFTGQAKYAEASAHAQTFVLSMYNDVEGYFHMGTGEDGVTVNEGVLPLDCNTWAILALGDSFSLADGQKVMSYVEATMAKAAGGYGFFESADPGVWHEGTAQVALVYLFLSDKAKAAGETALSAAYRDNYERILAYLNGQANVDGSITAADRDGVPTGLKVEGTADDWLYGHRTHVGATAWLAFAQLGVNPLAG